MDIKLQSSPGNHNRDQYYQQVYSQQHDTKQQLVNLEMFADNCVLIDCCAWHYQNIFVDKQIIKLETVHTAQQYKLDHTQFDKLVDVQQDRPIRWPTLNLLDPVLIFDRSPMLKYLSLDQISSLLTNAAVQCQASDLVINLDTKFIDDPRLVDRFYNLASICIENFTVREFVYSTRANKLFVHLVRDHAD